MRGWIDTRWWVAFVLQLAGCAPGGEGKQAPPGTNPRSFAVEQGQGDGELGSTAEGRLVAPATGVGAEVASQQEADFPLHGLVTGVQLPVRAQPQPQSQVLGWLRIGARVRLKPGAQKTRTCATGFYRVAPRGWACAGEGIEVAQTPPPSGLEGPALAKDSALPYKYYFAKELRVPEYHRLPTRKEQTAAAAFIERYRTLLGEDERDAERFYRGELDGEIKSPAVVRRYLDRGFFVAGAGIEERDSRRFVRTVRGRYVKLSQLLERKGSDFRGLELGPERSLPVAWAVRSGYPFTPKPRADGSLRLVVDEGSAAVERLSIVPWVEREYFGDRFFHKLADGRYLKSWFVAVAERVTRPRAIPANTPWVHIDLGQQTMVLYQGDEPVYATLVSSGLEEHKTPVGLFDVRAKHVATSMSDVGPEVSDDQRYSIEDVPWTQYFSGSIALHGAFWHERFGLPRSHGCVNLAPRDAKRAFGHTRPAVGYGWHGVSVEGTSLATSKVLVTED